MGEGPPPKWLGKNGQVYMDMASGIGYGPKRNGKWKRAPGVTMNPIDDDRH
jgi:hypothetical protein